MTKESLEQVRKEVAGEGLFYVGKYIVEEIRELAKDPEMAIAMCRKDGRAIQYIENPSEELSMIAVKTTAEALRYVKQTPEICMAAVQADGRALKHVKRKTDKLKVAAVKQNPLVYLQLRKTTPEIEEAAKCNWLYCFDDGSMKRLYGNAKQVVGYMREEIKLWRQEDPERVDWVEPAAVDDLMAGIHGCIVFNDDHMAFDAIPETEPEVLTA